MYTIRLKRYFTAESCLPIWLFDAHLPYCSHTAVNRVMDRMACVENIQSGFGHVGPFPRGPLGFICDWRRYPHTSLNEVLPSLSNPQHAVLRGSNIPNCPADFLIAGCCGRCYQSDSTTVCQLLSILFRSRGVRIPYVEKRRTEYMAV